METQLNNTNIPLGVQTNESVVKTREEYFTKFTSLNPSAEPLPQGDGTIRISPFDDYVIFTLFDETGENGEIADTPIDLSNVGTLTLVFVGETDEIRIPNWTQVQNVDLSQGQVLFRIDKENSKKILALDNQNFYISTRMESVSGVSDESVLYTGTFLNLQDAAKETQTAKMQKQAEIYADELKKLQDEIQRLNTENSDLIRISTEQISTIQSLTASNLSLTNEVSLLSDQLGTAQSELVLSEAEAAQAQADLLALQTQQNNALLKVVNESNPFTNSMTGSALKTAANNLESYNTQSSPASSIGGLTGGIGAIQNLGL